MQNKEDDDEGMSNDPTRTEYSTGKKKKKLGSLTVARRLCTNYFTQI